MYYKYTLSSKRPPNRGPTMRCTSRYRLPVNTQTYLVNQYVSQIKRKFQFQEISISLVNVLRRYAEIHMTQQFFEASGPQDRFFEKKILKYANEECVY